MYKVRVLFWICLISTFVWWGSKSVKRYWNQPLTTNMVYSYGDNDNGIQFPLMTFCDREFVKKNKIFQDCKMDGPYFIHSFNESLRNCKTFKLSNLLNSLEIERRDIIDKTNFWDGYESTNIDHLDDQIWSRVFHPTFGPCFMLDLSNTEKFEFVPYLGFATPDFVFHLSNKIPWKKMRIFLHTKYDLPDAYQLNGMIQVEVSNITKRASNIAIKKSISKRESTRQIPCTQYEYMTCQNIEDNNLILNEFDCQIPALQYGKHLEYIIPQETSICNDEVARKAMYLIANKTSNCSRQAFLSACN